MSTKKVIVGTLHTGPRGSWFECADEAAGTDANIFDSREDAQAALDYLGWDFGIYDLDDVIERCGEL